MINEVQEILINESEIQEKVKYLAEQINKDYAGKDIVLMIILKGSVVFSADLMRYLHFQKICKRYNIDFATADEDERDFVRDSRFSHFSSIVRLFPVN